MIIFFTVLTILLRKNSICEKLELKFVTSDKAKAEEVNTKIKQKQLSRDYKR